MKTAVPFIGPNGEIGEREFEQKPPPQLPIPRRKGFPFPVGSTFVEIHAEPVVYDYYELLPFKVQFLDVFDSKLGIPGCRVVEVYVYVHAAFPPNPDLSKEQRQSYLDSHVQRLAPWLFSYGTRIDTRLSGARWKP